MQGSLVISECHVLGLFYASVTVILFFLVLVGFTLGWLFANRKMDLEKEHKRL